MRLLPPLLLLACAPEPADKPGGADSADPADSGAAPLDGFTFAVDAAGPFRVGYRQWPVVYTLPDGSSRELVLNLWYPTDAAEGPPSTTTAGGVDPLSFADAPLAAPAWGGRHPVVLHSHGHQGWGANSADLARRFASHGWLFLAPDHTGNTLMSNLDPRPLEMYAWRPLDLWAALDALEADAAAGPTAATDGVLLSGHSYGAFTVWPAGGVPYDLPTVEARCAAGELSGCSDAALALLAGPLGDGRVKALMPMAGTISADWVRAEDRAQVAGPVMLLSGTEDDVGQQRDWDSITGVDYRWVDVLGACHQTFGLGTCDTLPPEQGFPIVNTYAVAWARFSVMDDADPQVVGIMDGSIEVSPGTALRHRGP